MVTTKTALAASSGERAFGIENRGTILRRIDLVVAAQQRQTICSQRQRATRPHKGSLL